MKLLLASDPVALPRDAPAVHQVSTALLAWFAVQGHHFSWRRDRAPFHVLVAEVLLRKTEAEAVERFLPAFLERYPTPDELAVADGEQLATMLAPLGLSRQRAKQLRALAERLVQVFGAEVPGTLPELLSLPGVGAYTAGILAATCTGSAVPAVDTNVARVLCRVFGLIPSHAEARKSTNVWSLAGMLVRTRPELAVQLTWAVLDLAKSTCTAQRPKCGTCPLQAYCRYARLEGCQG